MSLPGQESIKAWRDGRRERGCLKVGKQGYQLQDTSLVWLQQLQGYLHFDRYSSSDIYVYFPVYPPSPARGGILKYELWGKI